MPIVGVAIATPRWEERYDFEWAADFLPQLDTELERCTPGATKILAEHGYSDLRHAGAKLHRVLPQVISLSLQLRLIEARAQRNEGGLARRGGATAGRRFRDFRGRLVRTAMMGHVGS